MLAIQVLSLFFFQNKYAIKIHIQWVIIFDVLLQPTQTHTVNNNLKNLNTV